MATADNQHTAPNPNTDIAFNNTADTYRFVRAHFCTIGVFHLNTAPQAEFVIIKIQPVFDKNFGNVWQRQPPLTHYNTSFEKYSQNISIL